MVYELFPILKERIRKPNFELWRTADVSYSKRVNVFFEVVHVK